MTDHGNMFGAISFYNAMKSRGVKPIIGCETYITRGNRSDRSAGAPGEKANFHLDSAGTKFRRLSESRAAYFEGLHRRLLLQAANRQGTPRLNTARV